MWWLLSVCAMWTYCIILCAYYLFFIWISICFSKVKSHPPTQIPMLKLMHLLHIYLFNSMQKKLYREEISRSYLNMCMCVYMYLTQLFSAPHLSEALLPRECVRIGWLANAAKGRLGAPYFSWEKSEGCIVWPRLLTRSPCTRHRDLVLPELLLRPEYASLQRAKGIRQL